VFFSSKARVDDATRSLRSDGFPALAMHGDKAQNEREWVLREFRTGTAPVLLATDVAARGLDVAGVATVINFDAPASAETFAHRVGRTGRRGGRGDTREAKRAKHDVTHANVAGESEETHTFLCPSRARGREGCGFVRYATLRANGRAVSDAVAAFANGSRHTVRRSETPRRVACLVVLQSRSLTAEENGAVRFVRRDSRSRRQ
jgi:superfamily II DNA or RNA helicase